MLCAISGEAPQVPVVSRKTGNLYEKRLIQAHIAEHHTDPVTGEDLELDDLIELQSVRVQRPRPPTLTSVPSLLSTLQNEWDAIALETFQLEKELSKTRQELSLALYQNDAAVRVIARLTKERDDARSTLAQVGVSGGASGDAMQVDGQQLPDDLAQKIDDTQASLMSTRRKRPIPEGWATSEDIESFEPVQTTESLYPKGQALVVDSTGDLVIVGGSDGVAGIFSISKKDVVHALKSSGTITSAQWWGSKAIIGSSTGSVKVFENGAEVADLGSHAGAVVALALHPSGDILASVGLDKSYKLYDLAALKTVSQVYTDSNLTSGSFHPDGHLFAAGTSAGQIKLWDVKTGSEAAALDGSGPIHTIAFSENGTWLASVETGETAVNIWDLRKANVIKTLDIGSVIEGLSWDYTGQFLAVVGPGSVSVQQYSKSSKSWTEPFKKALPARLVQWGAQAASLVTLSPEGGLNILGSA